MASTPNRRNASLTIFRFGNTVRIPILVLIAHFACFGCSPHYCPSYSSTTYNKSFNYTPEKHLTFKPVKVHEFKTAKVNKSDKKEKSKARIR